MKQNLFTLQIPMHNLIEYSDNYSDSSDFVTDKKVNRTRSGVKIAIKIKIKIPLKYLSNFWRSLETLEIKMGWKMYTSYFY